MCPAMEISAPAIEDYLKRILRQEDPILQEMEEQAREWEFPIVGPVVGRILYQLTKISKARCVLELGSGFGYSAYWFGLALGPQDVMILTEFSKKNLDLAKDYFRRGKVRCQLRFFAGDALAIVERLPGPFDIVFNDVDKYLYPEVLQKIVPKVCPGGLLIADNILWQGKVLDVDPDADTRGILEYTRLILESGELFSSLIPARDGISVSLKL